jgi:hypothetical protein
VIERIDLMIFRAEQRRNAALHEIEQHRGTAMRQLQSRFEEGMIVSSESARRHYYPARRKPTTSALQRASSLARGRGTLSKSFLREMLSI